MPETDANAAIAVAEGAGVVGENAEAQPAPANSMWSVVKGMFVRMAVIYFISTLMRNWRGPQGQLTANGTVKLPGSEAVSGDHSVGAGARPPGRNLFERGVELDFYLYLSESEVFHDFDNPNALFWSHDNFIYGDWTDGPDGDGSFTKTAEIICPPVLQNNGSYYVHVFVVKSGNSPDPTSANYHKRYTIKKTRRLNKYKKKKYQKTANLLTGETDQTEEQIMKAETVKTEILSHWHPNLTINLVDDQTMWSKGSLPPPLDEYVQFDPVTGDYYPIFFFNDYWNLGADYIALNETVTSVNLSITVAPMSLFKWQMYASQSMKNKWTQILGTDQVDESDDDQDSLKQAILETNPYLLGMTIVVSLLHTIFEFLAFKNDIQFWRSRKSLEGLSVRSVLFNMFTSGVVLLYIIDNETNFVVRISVGIGMLIEMWKIPKVMDVHIDRENKIFGIIPRVRIADKGSYIESSTREYDILAFKYLSWLLYPLLGGYAVYSLIYHEHRGWYSFVLSMLYGFLLTFGFIMMTPQLFINYKLKSVAHLPWRMLSYKFLNTFIDDIFAFVIRMPTMYRIGCFRDDIVFLIYVYQRYIYRVDPKRVNEFGTSGEDHLGPDGTAIEGEDGTLGVQQAIENSHQEHQPPAAKPENESEEEEESNNRKSPGISSANDSSAGEDRDSGAEEGDSAGGAPQARQRRKRNKNKKSKGGTESGGENSSDWKKVK